MRVLSHTAVAAVSKLREALYFVDVVICTSLAGAQKIKMFLSLVSIFSASALSTFIRPILEYLTIMIYSLLCSELYATCQWLIGILLSLWAKKYIVGSGFVCHYELNECFVMETIIPCYIQLYVECWLIFYPTNVVLSRRQICFVVSYCYLFIWNVQSFSFIPRGSKLIPTPRYLCIQFCEWRPNLARISYIFEWGIISLLMPIHA